MNLTFKNIGNIPADNPLSTMGIGINGITLLKGDDLVAKTTVARAIFCTLNAFYNIDHTIEIAKLAKIKTKLRRVCLKDYRDETGESRHSRMAKKIYFEADKNDPRPYIDQLIRQEFPASEYLETAEGDYEKLVNTTVNDITQTLHKALGDVMAPFVLKYFENEFKGQIGPLHQDNPLTEVQVETFRATKFLIKNHKEVQLSRLFSMTARTFYLDQPFLLDTAYDNSYSNIDELLDIRGVILRQEHLQAFMHNPLLPSLDSKTQKVVERIDLITQGTVSKENKNYIFHEKGHEIPVRMVNVPASLKIFLMIRQLLVTGSLTEGGILIFDHLDGYLGAKYTKYFDALLVLLYQELGIKTLLLSHETTHLETLMETEGIPYEINLFT